MALARLPNELSLKIAAELPLWRDRLNLALTNRKLYFLFHNAETYYNAPQDMPPILMWAYKSPSVCHGPVTAAKKYLRAGGGGTWNKRWRKSEFLDIHRVFKHESRRNDHFASEVLSEIGRVIAMIVTPRVLPTDNLQARLAWLRIIMDDAQPEVLAKVEWQLLFCWLCRGLDDKSDASFKFLDIIMAHEFFRRSPALGEQPRSNFVLDRSNMRHLKTSHHRTTRHISDLLESLADHNLIWNLYYKSRCPLTHLFVTLREARSSRNLAGPFKRFMEHLLKCGATFVEDSALSTLIQWSKLMGDSVKYQAGNHIHILPALSQHDLTDMLKTLYQARFSYYPKNSNGYSSFDGHDEYDESARETWLGSRILPIACRENSLEATKILLELGADINARATDGQFALMHTNDPELFKLLFLHPQANFVANLNAAGKADLLAKAFALVLKLPYYRQAFDATGIRKFCEDEDRILSHIKLILSNTTVGVAANAPDSSEVATPLALAVNGADGIPWLAVIEMLVKAGADPNVRIKTDDVHEGREIKYTWPLHRVVSQPLVRKKLVNLLLKHGASTEARDGLGRTVRDLKNARKYEMLGWSAPVTRSAAKEKRQTKTTTESR